MYKNKNIIVCGAGKSGLSMINLLNKLEANVILYDAYKKGDDIVNEIDFSKKYDYMVLSPGIPADSPIVKQAKELGIEVIGEIELAYNVAKGKIIGITGTNGKTTTTTLIGEILKEEYADVRVVGNIGNPFSDYALDSNDETIFVIEISSYMLETIKDFKPDVAVILNITPDHLERHKTLENYANCKRKIYQNQNENDLLILNADDDMLQNFDNSNNTVKYFTINDDNKCNVYVKDNTIVFENNNIPIDNIKIMGTHNISNIMASIAAILPFNISPDNINKAISNFYGVEHRIEFVCNKQGVDVYNDSKGTNPDATIKAIKSMVKPINIILGGYDKKVPFDEIFTTSDNIKNMIFIGDVSDYLEEMAIKYNFKNYYKCEDLEKAVDKIFELSLPGECLLFSPACASFDMFANFEERGKIFKDIVNKYGG